MDVARFDVFVKSWTRGASRRRALGALAGVAAGALLRTPDAAAACLANGASCHHPTDCCSGGCKKKKGKKTGKCACPGNRTCSDSLCCPKAAACCNPGADTAACCARPGACATLYDPSNPSDAICCPPKRTFRTSAGVDKCCPEGEIAVGVVGPSGPCCAEQRACGDKCCGVFGDWLCCPANGSQLSGGKPYCCPAQCPCADFGCNCGG